jgi:hypothetical protein
MSYQDRPTSTEPGRGEPNPLEGVEPSRPGPGASRGEASAGDRAREAASTGQEQAREVASTAGEQARSIASTTQGEAAEVMRGAGEQARRLAGDARQELRSQADAQVDRLAQGLNDVSRQLRSMGEHGEPGPVSDLARDAAVRTQQMAERLRGGGVDQVVGQLRSVGRNRPGLFLLGAFGVGLITGRVVRNLAQEPGGNGSSDTSSTTGVATPHHQMVPSPPTASAPSEGRAS